MMHDPTIYVRSALLKYVVEGGGGQNIPFTHNVGQIKMPQVFILQFRESLKQLHTV